MRPRPPSSFLGFALGALLLAAAGCHPFPKDPESSLEKARRRGALRVGVSEAPPWVIRDGDEARGVEPALVRSFADSLGLAVEWRWGSVEEHAAALEELGLDVVAAGMTEGNPWTRKIGATRPYYEERAVRGAGGRRGARRHVLAVPPGENALLVRLERHLEARRSDVEPYLRRRERAP